MSCNLVADKNGKIINILDDSGNPSKLYKDAADKFGEEKGLEMYLVSKSNSFLDFFTPKNNNTKTYYYGTTIKNAKNIISKKRIDFSKFGTKGGKKRVNGLLGKGLYFLILKAKLI